MMTEATIINVDDNEPGRYAKGRILARAGFTVYDAVCGFDALSLVEQHNPDLVLLDVNLPDVNGIEVCRRLKTEPRDSSVIVLQISASAIAAPQATAALNNGADAYLTEPVDPDVLVATIKALLRMRKAERDLAEANERLRILNWELQKSNEDLQQFAFIASHDLQEPLRTISTFVSLLERTAGKNLPPTERGYLTHIAEGSGRMRLLIDDLLSYSRVGQKPAASEAVDLNAVLAWALENLRTGISKSQARIESDSLPTVEGDEAQLRHVFQNLIANAIKYVRPGLTPIIGVSAGDDKGEWLIRIRDNGLGIDSIHHETIFGAFKRLHGREIPGTGIGLAICRRVIEAHRGRIWVESKAGEGSAFCFTLPRRETADVGVLAS